MTRRIVFLDIDGVLNNVEWRDFARRTNDEVPRELRASHWLDPKAVVRLNQLLERTSAEVVLSSSWRQRGLESIQHMLAGAGFRGKLLDCTPLPEHHDLALFRRLDGGQERPANYLWPRHFEIQQWLNGTIIVAGIVILDSASMAHLEPWQVRTSLRDGLLDEHIDRACEVLARPGPRNFGKAR